MKIIKAAIRRVFPVVLAILMGGYALYGWVLFLLFKEHMVAEGLWTSALAEDMLWDTLLFGLIIFPVTACCSALACSVLMRPFKRIRQIEEEVLTGNLQQRIPLHQLSSGTRQLAHTLNQEFNKLEHSFDYQRQFTEDAAHELRTPIAAMRLQTDIALGRERDAADYRKALVSCQNNLQRLSECAEHLLDLSRLDRGESGEWQSCDLKELAEEALKTMDPVIQSRQVTLKLDLQSARIRGHVVSLKQVLLNLIANAIWHNEPKVTLELQIRKTPTHCYCTVADNGHGIPKAKQELIFQRFYRGESARKSGYRGTGLGLAIVETVVATHGGTLELDSSEGTGTRFTIALDAS